MIREILNKDFILKSTSTLQKSGKKLINNVDTSDVETSKEIREFLDKNEIELNELIEADEQIQKALEREESRENNKKTVLEPEEIREKDKADKVNYLPHDPILSLIQSGLQEYCQEKQADRIKGKTSQAQKLADNEFIPVTYIRLDNELKNFLIGESDQRLIGKYEYDLRWANCLIAAGIRTFWHRRHPFNTKPATPYKIGNNARVILLSDWGSGLPRAQKLSEVAIREKLDDPDATNRDKHVIHLGDVYYSGWAKEYEQNFLPYWAVKEGEEDKFSSWSLNANHDMYSGGKGYFETLLDDKRFKHQEKSSFFSLENDKWLLLGLDTGYDDNLIVEEHSLYGTQDEWVYKRLSEAKDKTGILLSHHQPFTAFPDIPHSVLGIKPGQKLLDKLKKPLRENLVEAWFWGHEHRCTFYEEQENIKFPRCIGHGGIPFYTSKGFFPAGVLDEYREGFDDLLEKWNFFGFVVLDFDDDKITVRYINERGHEHKTEFINAKSKV